MNPHPLDGRAAALAAVLAPNPDDDLPDPGEPHRSRRAGVRRRILADLRKAAAALKGPIRTWSADGRVYDGFRYRGKGQSGRTLGQSWRYRLPHEYPENDANGLRFEADRIRRIINTLAALARRLDDEALRAEAVCPNGCGPLRWADDAYVCEAPGGHTCGEEFHYETIHGRPEPGARS